MTRLALLFTVFFALSCGGVSSSTTDGAPDGDGAAGQDATALDAAAATSCLTASNNHLVFLNTNGGSYTMGAETRPLDNVSQVVQTNATVSGWQVATSVKIEMARCLGEVLAPFDIRVVETEPAAEPYQEIVVTSSPSTTLFPQIQTASIGEFGCPSIDNVISFVFTNFSDNPLTVCRSAASQIGFTRGLTRVLEVCEDAMTFTFECPRQVGFLDGLQTCGQSGDPRPCNCGGAATQNSAASMLTGFGACP